jgi:hypothetical protein
VKQRTLEHLMRLECYAYERWIKRRSNFWYRLCVACNKAMKAHPDFREC